MKYEIGIPSFSPEPRTGFFFSHAYKSPSARNQPKTESRGRVAMTVLTPTSGGTDDVTVMADQPGVVVASATAWAVNPIWVTPEVVKYTPRRG